MSIEKSEWHHCNICKQSIHELKVKYGGPGKYFTQVFQQHIVQDHNMSLEEYFDLHDICPCGICNKKLKIVLKGANFQISKYACGRNRGIIQWSTEAKTSRLGSNNPMFGKVPWNNNKTKQDHSSIQKVSDKLTGRNISDSTKQKQSISAKNRTIHGHTGHKHSEKTKEKLRQNTLQMIKDGKYKHTQTRPHKKCKELLDSLKIVYEEEKLVDVWSFDFYLPKDNLYIEIDGDYFHSNPKIYPKGPVTNTQKINFYRDGQKNNYCKKHMLKLIRFWESDILNIDLKEFICRLKK